MASNCEQDSVTGGLLRMIRQEGAGSKVLIDGTEMTIAGAARVPIERTGRYVMQSDADLTITVQGQASAGSYDLLASSTLRVAVIRP